MPRRVIGFEIGTDLKIIIDKVIQQDRRVFYNLLVYSKKSSNTYKVVYSLTRIPKSEMLEMKSAMYQGLEKIL